MTTPDPADVHTGADRVELTDAERETLWQSGEVSMINCDYDSNLVAAVESIVAARTADLRRWKSEAIEVIYGLQELGKALDLPLGERITGPKAVEAVQALTDERDELRASLPKRTRDWLAHCKVLDAERDAVSDQLAEAWKQLGETEAELAAANARLESVFGQLMQQREERRHREAERDALAARCAELEEEIMAHQVSDGYTKGYEHGTLTTAKFKAERAALQATLDRVTAVLDDWSVVFGPGSTMGKGSTMWAEFRAALTPEGKP